MNKKKKRRITYEEDKIIIVKNETSIKRMDDIWKIWNKWGMLETFYYAYDAITYKLEDVEWFRLSTK